MTTAMQESRPLNKKEQAQWLLHRLTPGSGLCNLGAAWRHSQQLRWWPLQEALNHVLRRHAALRTEIDLPGTIPTVRYLPEDLQFPLEVRDCTEDKLDQVLADITAAPFDLGGGLLTRGCLVLHERGSALCLVLHHLIADYSSITVLLSEISELYQAFATGDGIPDHLAGRALCYHEPDPGDETVSYWLRHLAGADPARMAMAGARPVPVRPTFAGEVIGHRLSGPANEAAGVLSKRYKLTANLVMLAAFYAVLAKHGAGPDLVVGVPVDARPRSMRGAVGFHTSTLPVRVRADPSVGIGDFLRLARESFLLGLEHAAASFEVIQSGIDARSADWRTPLFRHLFNFRPGTDTPRSLGAADAYSRLDVEWEVWPGTGDALINARYSTEVHSRADIAALVRRYEALLVAMAASTPDAPLGAVSCLTGEDQINIRGPNATRREWPDEPVLDAIAGQAAARPDATGIVAGDARVSYGELLADAGRISAALTDSGTGPGDLVALCASRSASLAAAVLGTWAAGAAYLPLDPAHPPSRLSYQLADARARVVLTDGSLPAECAAGRTVRRLTDFGGQAPAPVMARAGLADLAYLIYTSGSTGQPKGVEVTHGNLANVVRHFASRLALGQGDGMLWLTTFAFDISALELLTPLITGARVVVAPDSAVRTEAGLCQLITAGDVTVAQATPTAWRHLAPRMSDLAGGLQLLSGGEEISAPLAASMLGLRPRCLLNVYGPTETTIWSTEAELRAPVADRVPIGLPIANTTVHVLDDAGWPVPPGVPGELCIGGAGVARGYRNNPELTAAKFRTDPAIGRYYRTGDIVRLRPGGLEFIGRADRQVKIRGHRIELGDVECALHEHPGVRAAAVVAADAADGSRQLAAAVQLMPSWMADESQAARAAALSAHAASRLPAAAVPARFLFVPELPVGGSGKVDVAALRTLLGRRAQAEDLPRDDTLRSLVLAWRDVLGADGLGADANFFLCGGHSLLAGALAERVSASLGTEVELEAIFAAPTPRLLASTLRTASADG